MKNREDLPTERIKIVKVAFLGTGLMGLPMARRLLTHGIETIAYNRTPEKLDPLRAAGATVVESSRDALQRCDCAVLMLTDARAIREVVLSGSARDTVKGRAIVQMGTIAPEESRSLAREVSDLGGEYLEAPVLGSIPEAKAGNLLVMVGSTAPQFDRWRPLLQHFGEDPRYIGEVGAAAAVKLALNQLIAALTAAFSLSLGFVRRQGADVDAFMEILRQSALYAPTFDKKLSRMSDRDYENPNFPTKHLLKDTKLFLGESQSLGLDDRALDAVREILEAAIARNLAEMDYSALFEVVDPPR
ncbi:NAD(P)-dependent oxidoreductase [Oxynema aestuarii AP17]|jgi:3-hydroxyisobutyrate dehydrogenase|uniref:NAD(P)-dependent oxidoreductase n=2 Tax=Oxynema TaxID=1492710 RepID=A0A6H1U209_9CYAN|nr:NAD(P)-dependent oxidoreductase [Oxynema aestuarii AP17]RMH78648.1 MAG: NAD(P)-dependent oxidoreductase [Cyanobacteria bacterium J007]